MNDLQEQLESALEGHTFEDDPHEPVAEEEVTEEEAPEAEEQPEDEDGDQEADTEGDAEAGKEDEPDASEEAEDPDQDDVKPIQGWSEEYIKAFNALDKQTQRMILDDRKNLQRDYTKKSMELSDIKKEFDPIVSAMAPVDNLLQQAGVSRADAISRLVYAQQQLQTDPAPRS
jgi:cobalamin biosynthesis protein CobT